MDALGQERANLCDHIRLDRSHIRDRAARLQISGHFRSNRAHDAHGNAKNHQIRVFHGFRNGIADLVAQANFACGVAGVRTARKARHMTRKPAALHRPEHRRGDQTQPD